MSNEYKGPVMLVVTFFPKPGKLEQFLSVQREGLHRLIGRTPPPGWLGNRLCRNLDGQTAVMISMFHSVEAHRRFTERDDFAEHLERVKPLLERAESHFCEVVCGAGQF